VGYNALQWCVTLMHYAGALRCRSCVTAVRYAVGDDDVCYGALQCDFITSCVPATVTTRPSTVMVTSSI